MSSKTATPDRAGAADAPPPADLALAPAPELPELLPAPAGLTPAELEAFGQMNDALRREVVDIKKRLNAEVYDFMKSRYALGQAIVMIRDDPGTYGADSDLKIAAFFGDVGKTVLNEARRIVDRYPPERFRKILEARNPDTGFCLNWRHLGELLRIEDAARADQFLDQAMASGWSTQELRAAVNKSVAAGGGRKGAGRPKPVTFVGVLENLASTHNGWLDQYENGLAAGRALTDTFAKMDEDKFTPAMFQRLQEVRDVLVKSQESTASLARDLKKLCLEVGQALQKKKPSSATARAKIRPTVRDTDEDDDDDDDGDDDGDDGDEGAEG
jgi:hypothetical protein